MTDDELRKLWRAAGGAFHGPNIETGTMPESKLLPFLRNLAAPQPDSVPQDSGERAEFEVALVAYFAETQPDRAHKIDVDDMVRWRGTRGDYADRPVVRGMWEGWQRRAALAQKAVAVAGEPVQWQPIGTAPKTGRTLLLGYPNVLGKWRTVRGEWISQACIDNEWEEPENGEPGWYETSVEADDPPNCWPITPTHWMFLPAAPDADAVQPATPKSSPDNGFSGISGSQVATPPAPIASTREAPLTKLAHGAVHALRSYQFGNSSPDLAKDVADRLEAALKDAP